MKFSDIIGQEEMKAFFVRAKQQNKVSHAYIISGEDNSGKMKMAEAFANYLLCQDAESDSCGTCNVCSKVSSRNHPDIIYVRAEEGSDAKKSSGKLKVDDIRFQLNSTMSIRPYESEKKVYIVEHAETMNEQAQNALLKTIEEPPEYAVIILLTNNANVFLQTVLSRCILLEMKPVKDEMIYRYLVDDCQLPDYRAREIVAFSQGNIGKAKLLSRSEEFDEMKKSVLSQMLNVSSMNQYDMQKAAKDLKDYENVIDNYLDLVMVFYKDVLLYKATKGRGKIAFESEKLKIGKIAAQVSYRGLNNIFDEISEVRSQLKANVKYDLVIENMLRTMKENIQ